MSATVLFDTIPTLKSYEDYNITWGLTGSGSITLVVLNAADPASAPIASLIQNSTVPSNSFSWHPVNLPAESYILQAHGKSSFTYSNTFDVQANPGSTCELAQLPPKSGGPVNEQDPNAPSKGLAGGTKVLIAVLTIFLFWILLFLMKKRRELRPKPLYSKPGRIFLDFGRLFVVIGRKSGISDSQSQTISDGKPRMENQSLTFGSTENSFSSSRLQTSSIQSRSPGARTVRFGSSIHSSLATGSTSIMAQSEELTSIDAKSIRSIGHIHREIQLRLGNNPSIGRPYSGPSSLATTVASPNYSSNPPSIYRLKVIESSNPFEDRYEIHDAKVP